MATIPAVNELSTATNQGEMKTSLEDFRNATAQIPGVLAEASLTIASGLITPASGGSGVMAVDTEAAAANDDLTNIILTNIPDGWIGLLRPANSARTITVKHNVGGSGTISLRTGGDFTLGDTTHWLMVQRRGTTIVEIFRMPAAGVVGVLTKTANYTTTEADRNKLIDATSGTFTITLLPVARAGIGFEHPLKNSGTGLVTVDGNASETIDAALTLKLQPGHEAILVCDGTGWKSKNRHAPLIPRGYLWGMTISNNASDPTNDIDFASTGECASEDAALADRVILAPGAVTKRLDATWVAGTNQGGRSSSVAIANGTWHVFAMRVGGADDYGFDTSVTGANLIADHAATKVRRIGSIRRESAAIVAFTQDGDYFRRSVSILDYDSTNPGTSAVTVTLNVPSGITVQALLNAYLEVNAVSARLVVSDLAATNEVPSQSAAPLSSIASNITAVNCTAPVQVRTNTSGQVRSRVDASDAGVKVRLATLGWIDTRGRVN